MKPFVKAISKNPNHTEKNNQQWMKNNT